MDNMVEAGAKAVLEAMAQRPMTEAEWRAVRKHDAWVAAEAWATAAIAAVRPLILEHAAKVADDFDDPDPNCISDRIAQAIRALGERSNAG